MDEPVGVGAGRRAGPGDDGGEPAASEAAAAEVRGEEQGGDHRVGEGHPRR